LGHSRRGEASKLTDGASKRGFAPLYKILTLAKERGTKGVR
jgi:hypothetical protein